MFCKDTGHFVNSDRSRLCPKRACNGTGFSNSIFLKERFFKNAFIFVLFSFRFQETPKMLGLKTFKGFVSIVVLSISKLTYVK